MYTGKESDSSRNVNIYLTIQGFRNVMLVALKCELSQYVEFINWLPEYGKGFF